ncbi:MAG: hypothetical protein J6334_00965 [Kiritimatiellae bacterium]|nr:hypothetical protein [Kiritimatiellia bacterium]
MKAIMLVSLCVCVLMGGCKAPSPIVEPNCPITVRVDQKSDMKTIITRAAVRRRWSAVEIQPGVIRCTLLNRQHEVQVDVVYTDTHFEIRYVNSRNMDYDARQKTISRKYNQWVRNLEREILLQFSRASL